MYVFRILLESNRFRKNCFTLTWHKCWRSYLKVAGVRKMRWFRACATFPEAYCFYPRVVCEISSLNIRIRVNFAFVRSGLCLRYWRQSIPRTTLNTQHKKKNDSTDTIKKICPRNVYKFSKIIKKSWSDLLQIDSYMLICLTNRIMTIYRQLLCISYIRSMSDSLMWISL